MDEDERGRKGKKGDGPGQWALDGEEGTSVN